MEKNVIVTQVKVHHVGRHVKQPNILAFVVVVNQKKPEITPGNLKLTLPFFETRFFKEQDPNDQQRNTCILQDTVLFHI